MPTRARSQRVNPLLGVYFGIFAASLAGLVILLMIFEQLGVVDSRLRSVMTLGSLALYAAIGVTAYTKLPHDFLLSGRRVPSFYVGLGLAVSALGGTGLVAFTGILFLAGFDGLCLPVGLVTGFVISVLLIAPFLRKFGAPSLPTFLCLRFESNLVRLVAASVVVVPLLLLLVAELRIAQMSIVWLLGLSDGLAVLMAATIVAVTLAAGGTRSLTWSSAAQALTALTTVLLPAAIVAVLMTNLPIPQLSHGPILKSLVRLEEVQAIPVGFADRLAFDLPGQQAQAIVGRYATPFATVGPLAYVLAMLGMMLGLAGSPSLLARSSATSSVYEARKSIGWAVFLSGVVVLTMSAQAVFTRDVLVSQIAGSPTSSLPSGLRALVDMGWAEIVSRAPTLSATGVAFKRDAVLQSLPVLLGFPSSLVNLIVVGVLAAALATAAGSLNQMATILGEDVLGGPVAEPHEPGRRLLVDRGMIAVVAAVGALVAAISSRDPLDLMLWSLAYSAALFPVIMLAIWWKRTSALGALAGLAAGCAVTTLGLLLGAAGLFPLAAPLVPAIGAPAALVATLVVTRLSPNPKRHILEMVRDIRVPGGEPIYDRELRLARQQRQRRT